MSTLRQVAAGLRQTLDWSQQAGRARGWIQRPLKNGLQIVYSYCGDEWRLALRREGVPPSENEVAVIRRDFDVPEGALRFDNQQTETHPKTRRKIRYHRVELLWREQAAAATLPRCAPTIHPAEGPDAAVFGV